jgi:hypothetical protein
MVTARLPAATASPSAVWNDGHEIRAVPDAAVPSARYTVSLTVVRAGPCACNVVDNVNQISTAGSMEITALAALGKRLLFTANHLGMPCPLLVSPHDPHLGQ